jgi:hypothetical protein
MFNLEEAIADWRRKMSATGIQSAEVDELEDHLRDDIEQQILNGVDAQKAFDAAISRIGKAKMLQKEFERSSAPRKNSRQEFIEKFCFGSAAFVLLANTLTLVEFNMIAWERITGFFIVALVASYLASVPFLNRLLSPPAYMRFLKTFKVLTLLTPAFLAVGIFSTFHANNFGMGILPTLSAWLILAAIAITAFALGYRNDFGRDGGLGGPLFAPPFGPQPIPPGRSCPPEFGISIPSPDKFSPSARQSLEVAREEAARLGHDFIGTEHVLLGALKQEGAVTTILQNSNVDREAVRKEIERLVIAQPLRQSSAPSPLTPRARKALRFAGKEAKIRNQPVINLEHILLGLLLEGSGVAAMALKNLGIRTERIRAEISAVT